jgi:hypothetical protein
MPTGATRPQELRSRTKNSAAGVTTHAEAANLVHERRLVATIAAPFIEKKKIEELS